MKDNKTILAVMAHPDDIEFLCGSTLALLFAEGFRQHLGHAYPQDHKPGKILDVIPV